LKQAISDRHTDYFYLIVNIL